MACFRCCACDGSVINSSVLKAMRASEPGVKQACSTAFLGCCTDSFGCVMQAKVEESTTSLRKEVAQVRKEHAVTTSSWSTFISQHALISELVMQALLHVGLREVMPMQSNCMA